MGRSIAQICVVLFIAIGIAAPWFILVNHRSPEFLSAMIHEGQQHAIGGKEGHHFPPGYHLILVWPMFMPWSLLLPLAIGVGLRNRQLPEVRFALAAVLGPWLMVEFMGTKLPHYFLPAYPALAFLVAFAIRRAMKGEAVDLHSVPFRIGAALWAIGIILAGAAAWLAVREFKSPVNGAILALSASCALLAAIACLLLFTRRLAPAFVTMGLGMFAVICIAWMLYFPAADYLRISTHVASVLRAQGAVHPGDVKMVDYKEPSLAFYQGGTIREVEKKSELIYRPIAEWPRWVVITREAWEMIPQDTRRQLRLIDSCRGWAYADQGRVVEVLVIEKSVY